MSNILFLIPKNDVGGAPKFVKEQIDICFAENHTCFLATNFLGWINENTDSKICCTLTDKKIEKTFSITFLIKLISFIQKNNIELVICNSANGGLFGRIAAFLTNIKSIYISHGWSSVYNGGRFAPILNFIETILSYIGTKVLCISKGDIDKANKYIHVPKSKLVHINNAIFTMNKIHAEKNTEKIKIISVTRFRHPKRVDLLINAVKNIPKFELYIAGGGDEMKDLEKLIINEKINNVFLLGEIPSFSQYNEYDIFTLISDSEGLPMSAIEAMSAGLPLVLSNVGGCPELINKNGILVENNEQSIQNGFFEASNNLQQFSTNSLKLFEESFNLAKRKNEFLSLYSECLKK